MLQENTCEQLDHTVHPQQCEEFSQREVKQGQLLDGARPLDHNAVCQRTGEPHTAAWLRHRHLVQEVVHIALNAKLARAGGRHQSVQPCQELMCRIHIGQLTYQSYALADMQRILGGVIVALSSSLVVGGQLEVARQGPGVVPHATPPPAAARQLCEVHGLESLHGRADLPVANFLIEHVAEPVAASSILPSYHKAVELRLKRMLLRAELQPVWQA